MPAVLKTILLSFLACMAMHVWPSAIFAGALLWGISLLLAGYYLSLGRLFLLFSSNILLLLFLGDSLLALSLLGFYGVAVMVAAVLLNRGKSYYTVLYWAMLATVISISLYLGISYVDQGQEGINSVKTAINATAQNSLEWSEQSGFMEYYEQRGVSRTELEQGYTDLAQIMFILFPAFIYLQAIIAVYLMIFISSLLARKKKLPILERKPFREEIMPWQISWAVIAGLACCMLGWDQKSWLYYSGANILAVLAPVTVFYGTAQLAYWLKRWPPKNKKWIVALVVLLSFFFTVSTIIFIGLIGLFDSLLDYRKLRIKKEGI